MYALFQGETSNLTEIKMIILTNTMDQPSECKAINIIMEKAAREGK